MKKLCIAAGILAVWLFLVFVWPTAYKYEKFAGPNRVYLIRINRFNDSAAKLTNEGWITLRPTPPEPPPAPAYPP